MATSVKQMLEAANAAVPLICPLIGHTQLSVRRGYQFSVALSVRGRTVEPAI
jgi:hypothetical protein